MLEADVAPALIAVGSDIVCEAVAEQVLASVTVTVYVPAVSVLMLCVEAPLLQLNNSGNVPPLTVRLMAPSFPALQLTLAGTMLLMEGPLMLIIAVPEVAEHKLPSVTVTV